MRRVSFAFILSMTIASSTFAQPAPGTGNQPDMQGMEAIMKAMGAIMGGGTNTANLVDFRELKALLPAELPGLKRTASNAERSGAVGMAVALAEATYTGEKSEVITIKLTDNSSTSAMGGLMQFGWAQAEIDRESESGYERTTKIGGHPAMEKYDSELKDGETQIYVNKRFLVEVVGNSVSSDAIKDAVSKIDLAKLAALQPKAKEPAPAQ